MIANYTVEDLRRAVDAALNNNRENVSFDRIWLEQGWRTIIKVAEVNTIRGLKLEVLPIGGYGAYLIKDEKYESKTVRINLDVIRSEDIINLLKSGRFVAEGDISHGSPRKYYCTLGAENREAYNELNKLCGGSYTSRFEFNDFTVQCSDGEASIFLNDTGENVYDFLVKNFAMVISTDAIHNKIVDFKSKIQVYEKALNECEQLNKKIK